MTTRIADLAESPAREGIETGAAQAQAKAKRGEQIQAESDMARQAKQTLARLIEQNKELSIRIEGDNGQELELPARAASLLLEVLKHMTKGLEVVVTPLQPELTTRQAAEILMVSRPHLVKLLDKGEIPCRWVGNHRRILRDDVMVYSEKLKQLRNQALARMIAESQELGLYD